MPAFRRLLAAASCAVLAACGGNHVLTQADAGTASYALTLIGAANLSLHPGEKRNLQVIFAQDQIGPMANASLHFEFQDGDPAGAKLETYDLKTDANGIAAVHFTAGNTSASRPTFKLVVSSATYDAAPAAFSFSILPVRRLLQIVGAPGTRVSSDGQSASVSMYMSSSYGLKVRELDQDTGAPIAGDTLDFSLPPIAHTAWSGAAGRITTAITGASGEAQVFLLSSAVAEAGFLVVGQSAAGGAAVNYTVAVQPSSTATCTNNAQCSPGQICAGGVCKDGGGGTGCGNASDNPCPFSYQCVSGVCQPPGTTGCDSTLQTGCASGQCCDGSSTCHNLCPSACSAGETCVVQTGGACGSGICQPHAPAVPDVTGVWTTRHIFDIRQALPGSVRTTFTGLRLLDQTLLGKLTIPGLPDWINQIIAKALSALLKQYIPDWVQTIIHIGDDIGTILSNLRSEGSMRINAGLDATHIKGSEVWTSLVFYWLPLCNGNIQGDPDVPPECARFDIATTDSANPGDVGQCKGQSIPSITVQAAPFTGAITGTATPYTLSVDRRQVSLKMGKVILVVIDYLISLTTPYHCIDEATDCHKGSSCLVNCPQLGQDLSNLSRGLISADQGEQICDTVVSTAGQAATFLLANAWPINADVLDFSGHATIHEPDRNATPVTDCTSGSRCADQLGNDSFDRDLRKNTAARDGNWQGAFFFKVIPNLPGAWEGKRPQQ